MEKNIATIYKIANKINGKVYIGFDSSWPKRLNQHRILAYNKNTKDYNRIIYRAIRKYGIENFLFEAIYQSKEMDHCKNVMEKYFIEEYNSFIGFAESNGYNMTLGGDGTFGSKRPKSDEYRKELSHRMTINNPRSGYKYTEQEIIDHSNRLKLFYKNNPDHKPYGEKNGMFNKKHPPEWRSAHSEKMKRNTTSTTAMAKKRKCIYCGMETTTGNIARWHNENCKNK